MKCERCHGTGQITCPDCKGKREMGIRVLKLDDNHPNHEELRQLQNDVIRADSQLSALLKLNPRAEASYRQQHEQTVSKIERQAKELLKN